MKYMGSKRSMLLNGLGEALASALPNVERFVDLFSGSGAVANHVAQHYTLPVHAYDLQHFAAYLARATVARTSTTRSDRWAEKWIIRGLFLVQKSPLYDHASTIQSKILDGAGTSIAIEARDLCTSAPEGSLTKAYGGYYFSPLQVLLIDALRASLPRDPAREQVAIAALIQTASKAAASPGHTAQPFKPNLTAGPYLLGAWRRDLTAWILDSADRIDKQHAHIAGAAEVQDAAIAASSLKEGDLAFVDPPYSSVHYSRFYHVLESLARGEVGDVSGSGRYPHIDQRPSSDYSTTTKAASALAQLFKNIGNTGAQAIVTFPASEASNGLSGDLVKEIAADHFVIAEAKVTSRFSTLGGNRKHREARQDASELILTLTPR